jgi:hypothetical protein
MGDERDPVDRRQTESNRRTELHGVDAAYNPAKHRSDPCVKISSYSLLISPIIFYGGLRDMIRVSISESHRLRFTVSEM